MNESPSVPPPLYPLPPALSPEKALHRLFLTLFLRGRSSRGLRKEAAPKSLGSKLTLMLVMYAFIGTMMALMFMRQTVFAMSVYLHAMTLAFLGMFVAASAGEILFNKEESDILLHRPVTPKALLRAKVTVLVQVSLWLAGSLNLAAFIIGVVMPGGSWFYPLAHAVSMTMEALFCTSSVIVVYQLCLRWCGRERLEGLMTTAQVVLTVAGVLVGQVAPRLMMHMNGGLKLTADAWWLWVLPPAWFAGFDEVLTGGGTGVAWGLAALGLGSTAMMLWLAFGKLARDYETGLQAMGEARAARAAQAGRRLIDKLVNMPPLSWWLRDPVSRASFLLTAAYLVRDRDVKLRVYPGIAPMLVMPVIFLAQGRGGPMSGGFGVAFAGSYLCLVPLLCLDLLRYSQQWQAADIFRSAPMPGPAALCHGARRAVLCLVTLPVALVFAGLVMVLTRNAENLLLLLPGVIALPIFALIPSLRGKGVPLSTASEEAKPASRGVTMIVTMLSSFALAGLAQWAWSGGWFAWMVGGEAVVAVGIYGLMRTAVTRAEWPSIE